jgi:hypothetical protein
MVKSCLWGRLERSILEHILINKEPSLVTGLSQTAFGGNRNLEESGGIRGKYRNSCPTGIPAKKSCKIEEKNRIPATSPKPHSCEKFLWKTQEKKETLRNPGRDVFLRPKYLIPENRNRQPRMRGEATP